MLVGLFIEHRLFDLEHHVGGGIEPRGVIDHGRPGVAVVVVGNQHAGAGALLDMDGKAEGDIFFHGFRGGGDPSLLR